MQTTPSRPAVAAGDVVGGRYQIRDLLGHGGMAEVYDGLDLRLERPVAVKLLRREMAARDDVRTRFEAEARAAAGLSHTNAVAVFDTGEHEGLPFLIMERLPGDTLADRIAAGPVDPAWLRGAAAGVLGALRAAHQAGIVHRDVKPGNILLGADGTAKIADFGIAKSISPEDDTSGPHHADLTGTGQLLGTPAYLAPERIEGMPASPRSDLWALGVVMYEALAGRKPFTGETPLQVASAVVDGDHVSLDEVRPDLDPDLVATIERAMSRDPADRFASAAEMAAALTGAPDTLADTRADSLADATMVLPLTETDPVGRVTRRRRPVGWLLVGLAVLALVIGVAVANRDRNLGAAAGPPVTSTAPATTLEQKLTSQLRSLAARLTPANDGARAADLAAGLERVADAVEAESPAAPTLATALIISAGAWNQTGQLSDAATVSAVQLLQQIPGVQVPSQGGGAATVAPSQSQPTVTSAPPVSSGSNARGDDDDDGKGENRGKGKSKD